MNTREVKLLQSFNQKKHILELYLLVFLCCLFALAGCTITQQRPTKKEIKRIQEPLHIKEYVLENDHIFMELRHYAGEIVAMNEGLRKQVDPLIIPVDALGMDKQYKTSITYEQYQDVKENIGPYAHVLYKVLLDENQYILANIMDMKYPREPYIDNIGKLPLKPYKGYQIAILYYPAQDNLTMYCMIGIHKKHGYKISVEAVLENEEDFVSFLEHFLI